MAVNSASFKIGFILLAFFVFVTVFERFNIFLPAFGFSLKLSLLVLPFAALFLLWSRKLLFNATFLFPALLGLGLAQFLSVFLSFDRGQSLQVLVFTILMIALFYFLVWGVIARSGEGRAGLNALTPLIWSWGVGALLVSILGIGQFWLHFNGFDPALTFDSWFSSARTLPVGTFTENLFGILDFRTIWEWGTNELLRPSSTFIDVNTGASFVGIFLLLGGGWWLSYLKELREKFNWDRFLTILGLTSILMASLSYFLLTLSRSATLGLGVGAAVFLFFLLRNKLGSRFLGVVLAILILGASWFGYNLSYGRRTASSLARAEYSQAAWEMFKINPLTGVGVGNFEPYCLSVLRPDLPACYSHSIFLTWLGELGILGILANFGLIFFIYYFTRKMLNTLSQGSLDYFRLASLLAGFTALVFANVFHAHYGLDFSWVLIGLLVSGYYLARGRQEEPKKAVKIMGVRVDNVTMEEAIGRIKEFFRQGRKGYVVTPNPEMVMSATKDKEFTHILNKSSLSIPDGMGLIWASRIWGTPLKERVSGADFLVELCALSARRGGKVLFLDNPDPTKSFRSAPQAAKILRQRFPKLKVDSLLIDPSDEDKAISEIKRISRGQEFDLLFLSYGHGKQERWMIKNLEKVPVKIALGTGGSFDFVAGNQKRAPQIFRSLGLEWLWRVIRQPWRIKRQLALIPFSYLAFKEAFRR